MKDHFNCNMRACYFVDSDSSLDSDSSNRLEISLNFIRLPQSVCTCAQQILKGYCNDQRLYDS